MWNMKALAGAFNQEKALVGAFSVIVQLHRLIVYSTSCNITSVTWCVCNYRSFYREIRRGGREDQVCSVRYNPGHSINATKGCNGCEMGSNGRAAAAAALLQCVHTTVHPRFNPFHTLRRVRRSSLSWQEQMGNFTSLGQVSITRSPGPGVHPAPLLAGLLPSLSPVWQSNLVCTSTGAGITSWLELQTIHRFSQSRRRPLLLSTRRRPK